MSARVELYREENSRQFHNAFGALVATSSPGKWRWRFVKNGRVMADSGQGYSRRVDCLNGAATVLGARVIDLTRVS